MEETLEFSDEIEGEEQFELDPKSKKIFSESKDPEVDGLYNKYKSGRLTLQPAYQREYVWDSKKASKLIESVLLAIPLPIIYLSQEKDGRENAIDGQQRLTSFFAFIDGKFPDGKFFKLSGLKVLPKLNGNSFSELDETDQAKIKYYTIRTVTFQNGSDEDLKFEIFERLNTGSVQLNDQELRNCIYRGPLNDALKDMARDPDFMHICGFKAADKRMRDVDLVLRFIAFRHYSYLKYKPPIKSFLNTVARELKNISDADLIKLKKSFRNACQNIRSLLDTNSFRTFYAGAKDNPEGHWEIKFNFSLFDILMYTFAEADKNQVYANLDCIRESFIDLMTTDENFIKSIEISTSSIQAVKQRFDIWRLRLDQIFENQNKQKRCFTFELKNQLFKNNGNCGLCGQQILSVDDSAVDHIEQYWLGGKTIPENARLTHRYCNAARPRKE